MDNVYYSEIQANDGKVIQLFETSNTSRWRIDILTLTEFFQQIIFENLVRTTIFI
jgi:hypothetical protein